MWTRRIKRLCLHRNRLRLPLWILSAAVPFTSSSEIRAQWIRSRRKRNFSRSGQVEFEFKVLFGRPARRISKRIAADEETVERWCSESADERISNSFYTDNEKIRQKNPEGKIHVENEVGRLWTICVLRRRDGRGARLSAAIRIGE